MKNIVHKKTYAAGIINLVAAALCFILIVSLIVWLRVYANGDITNPDICEEDFTSAIGNLKIHILFFSVSIMITFVLLFAGGHFLIMLPAVIGGIFTLKASKDERIISDTAYKILFIFKILALIVLAIMILFGFGCFHIIPFVSPVSLVIAALYITAMVLEQSERTQARTIIKTLQ